RVGEHTEDAIESLFAIVHHVVNCQSKRRSVSSDESTPTSPRRTPICFVSSTVAGVSRPGSGREQIAGGRVAHRLGKLPSPMMMRIVGSRGWRRHESCCCRAPMKHLIFTIAIVSLAPPAFADGTVTAEHPEMWMFDTKPITATSPGKSKDTFKIGEHIYARVFYDRPIKDVFSLTPEQYGVRIYEHVLEGSYDTVEIWIDKKDFGNKWIDLEILPDPATAHTKFGADSFTFH